MKSIIFTLLFTLIFITGCTHTTLQQTSLSHEKSYQKLSKNDLINKAETGDIKAMIILHDIYLFPEFKEGFDYYNKWYESVLKSGNAQEIFTFAQLFKNYSDMFINGSQKYIALLEKSYKLGDKKACYELMKYYKKKGKYIQINTLQKKFLAKASLEDMYNLYVVYQKHYFNNDYLLPLEEQIKAQDATLLDFYDLKDILYMRDKKRNDILLNKIFLSNNLENIKNTAKFLVKMRYYKEAVKFYEKAIALDANNSGLMYEVAKFYDEKHYKLDKDIKKRSIEYYYKAALMGNNDASKRFLYLIDGNEKYVDSYYELKNKLMQTPKGQKIFAEYLYEKGQRYISNEILDKLAKSGDQEAIMILALRRGFTPEERKLSREYENMILDSKSPAFIAKFYKMVVEYKYKYFQSNKELRELLFTTLLIEQHIPTLRDGAKQFRYKDKVKTLNYLSEASSLGDTGSSYTLIQQYRYNHQLDKAVVLLKKLVRLGDIKAMKALGKFYNTTREKAYKDRKKALYYYEKAAQLNDFDAMRMTASLYECKRCKDGNKPNYKKAFYYYEKLMQLGDSKATLKIAQMYKKGQGTKENLQKAVSYYTKAIDLGNNYAYYELAWLYTYNKNMQNHNLGYSYLTQCILKNAGSSLCKDLMGVYYENGYIVKKDRQKAAFYYEQVADFNPFAAEHLANYYRDNKEYKKAFRYYSNAARYGMENSLIALGFMNELGLGVPKNIDMAIKFYTKAYEETKSTVGAYNLGLVYHYGKGGIKKDFKLAKEWYKKSNLPQAKDELKKLRK